MKVGIIGGTGNISTSIVHLLLEKGHEVVCFNRGQSRQPLAGARIVVVDRHNTSEFERKVRLEKLDAGIDMVCFNAEEARSSVSAFQGAGHFIQCSTVCTYGIDPDWMPVTEDHPLRPLTDYGRGKVAADHVFLEAYHRDGFPATILKPSTTYGPIMGCVRQVAWDFTWIDRIRKGLPIAVCGDGTAIHQFLHVDDAARAFAGVLGKSHCIGQTYNVVRRGFHSWKDYHQRAMKVLGREVDLIGIPLQTLIEREVPEVGICKEIFAHNSFFSSERLCRDVPEFQPAVSLEEGLKSTIEALDRDGRIPPAESVAWEDAAIQAQRKAGHRTVEPSR